MSDIFVSYRRDDASDVTGRVFDGLKAHFGLDRLFKDVEAIPLGDDYRVVIADALARCKVVLVVIGDGWLTCVDDSGNRRVDNPADAVHLEVATALEREIPVIPLLVEGQTIPTLAELPAPLHKLHFKNGLPVRPDPDFIHDMERLCSSLERFVPARSQREDAPSVDIIPRVRGRLGQIEGLIRDQGRLADQYRNIGHAAE